MTNYQYYTDGIFYGIRETGAGGAEIQEGRS